jgi:hypothetical protein
MLKRRLTLYGAMVLLQYFDVNKKAWPQCQTGKDEEGAKEMSILRQWPVDSPMD